MKTLLKYTILPAAVVLCASCEDFLSKNATNKAYVTSIDDVNELILGEGYWKPGYLNSASIMTGQNNPVPGWIHVMDDDSKIVMNSTNLSYLVWGNTFGPYHFWLADPFVSQNYPCPPVAHNCWKELSRQINAMNVIMFELRDQFQGEKRYNELMGEALFLRALYHFFMVNLYGQPYDKANAGGDEGIPLKLSETVDARKYARNTVGQVYASIAADLEQAVTLLEGITRAKAGGTYNIYRPDQTAARLLLSRVYLYMNDWQGCIGQCEKILASPGRHRLRDYKEITPGTNILQALSPETIFTNGDYSINQIFPSNSTNRFQSNNSYAGTSNGFKASAGLMTIFDKAHDYRMKCFEWAKPTSTAGNWPNYEGGWYPTFKFNDRTASGRDGELSDNCTFRFAEVYLNLAEACAQQGGTDNETKARTAINTLRAKRFSPAYANLEVGASGDALIDTIRNERRRELCFEGHRWFDLRRYAVIERHPYDEPIRHYHDDEGNNNTADGLYDCYYELPRYRDSPKGGNWVMPAPQAELDYNMPLLIRIPRATLERKPL